MTNPKFIPAMFFHWMTPYYEVVVTPFMRSTWRRIAKAVADTTPPNGVVADVGCGPGTILRNIHTLRSDISLHGSDIDPAIIAIANRKKDDRPIAFEVASIDKTPYEDHSVDVVVSSLMFHHLDVELQRRAFAELRRILKPNGVFLLCDFSQSQNWRASITKLYAVFEPSIKTQINGSLLRLGKEFQCTEETLWTVFGCISLHKFTFPFHS